MATTPQDISRGTTGVNLPLAVSGDIWQTAILSSAVMGLTPQIPLPGAGVSVDIITGDPTAQWVNETDAKPVDKGTVSSKNMRSYTLAVIEPFSNQFRRDKSALYDALVARLPMALARKFDSTVLFGTAPGSDFDTLTAAAAVSLKPTAPASAYDSLLTVESNVATVGGMLSGVAVAPQGFSLLRSAKDTTGRPLFVGDLQTGDLPQVLGASIVRTKALYKAGTPNTVGMAGDFSFAAWGSVEGISVSISDQATLTLGDGTALNLWQRNMFAVRAEIEVGFRVRDIGAFNRLTD